MLSFSLNATPQMKELRAREARTHVVVQMEQLDEKDVRVRLTQLGFGHGSEWDSYYEYFRYGWPKKLLDLKTYVEGEFEKHGNATERSETTTRPDEEDRKGASKLAAESNFAKMSATTEQHKQLEPFAGTFKAEVKMWMGPGDPMVYTGVMTNTLVLEGRFLQQVFKGDPGGGSSPNTEGCGFWGFNKATNKYEGFWIDTHSTKMQTEVGDVDDTGRVWTMVGEMTDPTGKTIKKRTVITLEDNDHHKLEMFFPGPDGNKFKGMEIRYERK